MSYLLTSCYHTVACVTPLSPAIAHCEHQWSHAPLHVSTTPHELDRVCPRPELDRGRQPCTGHLWKKKKKPWKTSHHGAKTSRLQARNDQLLTKKNVQYSRVGLTAKTRGKLAKNWHKKKSAMLGPVTVHQASWSDFREIMWCLSNQRLQIDSSWDCPQFAFVQEWVNFSRNLHPSLQTKKERKKRRTSSHSLTAFSLKISESAPRNIAWWTRSRHRVSFSFAEVNWS